MFSSFSIIQNAKQNKNETERGKQKKIARFHLYQSFIALVQD